MAKVNKPQPEKLYPSEYGSHTSMVDIALTDQLTCIAKETTVVCKDQFGLYTTEKWRLDTNMADPNRYAGNRVKIEK